ncbi:NAD+ synthase [filamentous cyanobacterium CCP5]|nr:NAD+ synthase [filamentous cyanobacterium CCP5]
MKIAIAQLNPTIGDLSSNAQQILTVAKQAAAAGAQLMVTTEMSLCGYPPRDLLLLPSFIQAMQDSLMRLARDLPADLAVLVGLACPNPEAKQRGEKPLFNSTALLYGGEIRQLFHKQLLPTYDVFEEDRYFAEGQGTDAFLLGENGIQIREAANGQSLENPVRIGVTICEDLWNDEDFWGGRNYPRNPIADLAGRVDLVVNLSASPYAVNKQTLRENMLGHSANRYHCPIIYANQVGGNDDLIFDGSSVAVNREGAVVSRLKSFETDLEIVEFDPEQKDIQAACFCPLPESEAAQIWSALVLGVQDYARKCGFSKAVLGLSGGVDSALVAAIATAALGPDNVLAILMPSPYSSEHSVKDARMLCQNLGITYEILKIGDIMGDYDHVLDPLFAGTEFGVAEENVQSRIRGNLLMAVSNKFGHLLLSTGNKSEMAVGYCTLYGDMNGGLAVIADLPKTWVYKLCQWLNGQESSHVHPGLPLETIPHSILTKAPGAELKPGQVDQDSLPAYEVLDDILERLLQKQESIAEIIAAGHDRAIVEKVVRLVSRAEFKRRQAPPVLKVTDRAFGIGWRMPIAGMDS